MNGGSGNDCFYGGDDNDMFSGGSGFDDFCDGDVGIDMVDVSCECVCDVFWCRFWGLVVIE